MRIPTMITAAIILTAGCNMSPTTPVTTTPVTVDDATFMTYWHELEGRWGNAGPEYRAHPLPSPEFIRWSVRFFEFPDEQHESCFYRVGTGNIYVGAGRWQSSCVPHEIGHAVCDITYGHADWCVGFEH